MVTRNPQETLKATRATGGGRSNTPLSTLLSQALIAYTIELDNEFEHRFVQAGGRARVVSLVMWSNFLRFVGDGITVGELPGVAGLPKSRMLSTLGGMERWRYIAVGTGSSAKRDGFGSARGLKSTWVVRPTANGRKAEAIWPKLFDEIAARWRGRFGVDEVDALESSLRAIVEGNAVELPEYLPIVGGAKGMVAGLEPTERRDGTPPRVQLCALLARALLLYTLDFERESALSLPLCANVVRVLDEAGVLVDEIPPRSGISKEAMSMALTFLVKSQYVAVDGATAATKLARLTPEGRAARDACGPLHSELESGWDARFGAAAVRRLRSSLELLLERRKGARTLVSLGLEPYADGWRASAPYATQTQAVMNDPVAALPHYPMVLHRGGWPDGS